MWSCWTLLFWSTIIASYCFFVVSHIVGEVSALLKFYYVACCGLWCELWCSWSWYLQYAGDTCWHSICWLSFTLLLMQFLKILLSFILALQKFSSFSFQEDQFCHNFFGASFHMSSDCFFLDWKTFWLVGWPFYNYFLTMKLNNACGLIHIPDQIIWYLLIDIFFLLDALTERQVFGPHVYGSLLPVVFSLCSIKADSRFILTVHIYPNLLYIALCT